MRTQRFTELEPPPWDEEQGDGVGFSHEVDDLDEAEAADDDRVYHE